MVRIHAGEPNQIFRSTHVVANTPVGVACPRRGRSSYLPILTRISPSLPRGIQAVPFRAVPERSSAERKIRLGVAACDPETAGLANRESRFLSQYPCCGEDDFCGPRRQAVRNPDLDQIGIGGSGPSDLINHCDRLSVHRGLDRRIHFQRWIGKRRARIDARRASRDARCRAG